MIIIIIVVVVVIIIIINTIIIIIIKKTWKGKYLETHPSPLNRITGFLKAAITGSFGFV